MSPIGDNASDMENFLMCTFVKRQLWTKPVLDCAIPECRLTLTL